MAQPAVTLHTMLVPGVPPNKQAAVKVGSFAVPQLAAQTAQSRGYVDLLRKVELRLDAWEAADCGEASPAYRPPAFFENAATFANDIARQQQRKGIKSSEGRPSGELAH